MNSDKEIAVYDSTISARTYLSYISEQAGGFACIGRDGKLYIRTIGENIAELPIKYLQKFSWGEKFKISRIYYEDGVQTFETGDTTNNTVYISQDNMYIVEQEQIDNIYNQLNGLEVYGFEGDSIVDPALDIGDLLLIDGKYVIYQGSSQYGGKWKANISSKIQCKSKEETTTRTISEKTAIRRVQSQINQVEGEITQLVEQQTETNEKLAEQKITVDGVTTQVSDIKSKTDDLTGEVEVINSEIYTVKETVQGWSSELKNSGGNNIFYYSLEFWENNNGLEEYSDTEIIQNSISQLGYALQNGSAKQKQSVKNGFYTCSFKYKKLLELAVCQVKINGTTYDLTSTEWEEFEQAFEVTANTIEIEFISDTDNSLYIADLMVNVGTSKLSWTQNSNETRTDTVTIGKGIQVDSSAKNTYHRIDADGNRTYNKATGKVVNEATDKGSEMEELVVRGQAKVSGLLFQKVSDQVWINSLL